MAKRRRGSQRPAPHSTPRSAVGRSHAPVTAGSASRGLPGGPAAIVLGVVAVAAILVLLGGVLGGSPAASPTPLASATATPVGTPAAPGASGMETLAPGATQAGSPTTTDVRCDANEQFTMHIHAHLNIVVDGQLYLPPANVGITPTCFYWLHTHAATGVIHVESPTQTDFTLGQFFDVWGEPLSTTQVADHSVGSGEQLFVFIDGQRRDGVDPRTIVLTNLETIELQIGSAPRDPLPYTWPDSFK